MKNIWLIAVSAIAGWIWIPAGTAIAQTNDRLPPFLPGGTSPLGTETFIATKGFAFEGNTVFTGEQLTAVADEVLQRRAGGLLTSEDLDEIRTRIALKYINAGYINSGAILPNQTMTDGIVHFTIIEGKLKEIRLSRGHQAMQMSGMPMVSGSSPQSMQMSAPMPPQSNGPGQPMPMPAIAQHSGGVTFNLLSDSYITDRVALGAGPPLNLGDLKTQLELLREDPNIQAVNAELMPGDRLGESVLDLAVTEKNPFQVGLEFGNPRSPSVGAYEGDVLASDSDLTGHGDSLAVRYGAFTGSADDLKFAQATDFSIDYSIPVTKYDTRLTLDFSRSTDLVVESPFDAVDIGSHTDSYSAYLSQPVYRRPNDELDLSVGFTARYNNTTLLGEPFSFSPGADNGDSNAVALRFAQSYSTKTDMQAISARSTFGFGIDAADATINSGGLPDSRFFDWLGQFQYVRRIPHWGVAEDSDGQLIFRANTQLSANPLLAVEQFGLGGMDTVRGYRVDQLVSDNALQGTLEFRTPLISHQQQDILDLAPFVDTGYAWDVHSSEMPSKSITSLGMGVLFNPDEHCSMQVYYGCPLQHFQQPTHDLQDIGVDFNVTLLLF